MPLTQFLAGGNEPLASILWPLISGVVLAACVVFFNKQTVGRFVKALFDAEASTPESAKTLAELGYDKNRLIRHALRPGAVLRKMVHVSLEEADGVTTERYYIPEECAYRAEVTYNPDGSSVLTLVIAVVAFFAVAMILMSVIPDLIGMLTAAFTSSSGNGL